MGKFGCRGVCPSRRVPCKIITLIFFLFLYVFGSEKFYVTKIQIKNIFINCFKLLRFYVFYSLIKLNGKYCDLESRRLLLISNNKCLSVSRQSVSERKVKMYSTYCNQFCLFVFVNSAYVC